MIHLYWLWCFYPFLGAVCNDCIRFVSYNAGAFNSFWGKVFVMSVLHYSSVIVLVFISVLVVGVFSDCL
jgi:hypothetical protein